MRPVVGVASTSEVPSVNLRSTRNSVRAAEPCSSIARPPRCVASLPIGASQTNSSAADVLGCARDKASRRCRPRTVVAAGPRSVGFARRRRRRSCWHRADARAGAFADDRPRSRIHCSVLRLNRPEGCSGSGAGLLSTTMASSSCSTRIAAFTSGSEVAGMRCKYALAGSHALLGRHGLTWCVSKSSCLVKSFPPMVGRQLREDAAERVEQRLAVVFGRDAQWAIVVVRLAAGQGSGRLRDGRLALGNRALPSARRRSKSNTGKTAPNT